MSSGKGVDVNTLIKKKFKKGLFNYGQDIVIDIFACCGLFG